MRTARVSAAFELDVVGRDGGAGLAHGVEQAIKEEGDQAVRAGTLDVCLQPDLGVHAGPLVAGAKGEERLPYMLRAPKGLEPFSFCRRGNLRTRWGVGAPDFSDYFASRTRSGQPLLLSWASWVVT